MKTCEHCQDRLVDYVYELLDEKDLQEMREHLHGCPPCQAALEQVRADQQILARAAQAVTDVPEFTLASDQPAKPNQGADTLPLTPAPPTKRVSRRTAWISWSAAAAVLIAVTASFSYYRHTIHGLQTDLAANRHASARVSAELAALPAKYSRLQRTALDEVSAKAASYLHVVGPKVLQPGAKAHLDIVTRDIDGKPAASNLRVKVAEGKSGRILQVLHVPTDEAGQAHVELDASDAKAKADLNLIVESETRGTQALVRETVQVRAPTYVTRLDTNKIAYQLKDVLFFRVLVLDHYHLTPPGEPIAMRVELLNPNGQPVRTLDLPTGAGGILAREFAIDDTFQAGSYTLRARAVDPNRTDVQTISQRLEIVHELLAPDIQFDQDRYLPGDRVTGTYRGASPPSRALIGKEAVPFNVQPQFGGFGAAGSGGAGGKAAAAKKDGKGAAAATFPMRFEVPLPTNLPAGPNTITLQTNNGTPLREVRATIPIAPTDFTIDFFPEGGDLIAGVKNRVFYRVRSKSGEPVNGDGKVILFPNKNGPIDSSYHLGMGYFDFIPDARENYTVRITTPVKIESVANPFAKLGMRGDGVVVHVPTAVGVQGDPIRLTIRQQGPARKLLVVAQCRGQIVDQRWVDVNKDSLNLILRPTQEAAGMIRVTAYELVNGAALAPVAERLVYRRATRRLDLGFRLNTHQLDAGQKLVGKVSARDEKGQPAPAWLLASVIDERFQASPRSLSAHFYLLNEIHAGADLDNAQIILHDSPESAQVLERFLGTHGWRRFPRSQAPQRELVAEQLTEPLVFSRENQPLDALQKQDEAKRALALAPIQRAGAEERIALEDRRAELAGAVALAARNLADFEELIQVWVRLGMGLACAVLVGISLILMAVGMIRILRAQKTATPSFGGAFVCLVLCLGIFFVGGWLGPIQVSPDARMQAHAPAKDNNQHKPDTEIGRQPIVRANPDQPVTGAFALLQETGPEKQQDKGKMAEAEKASKDVDLARINPLANALARRNRGGDLYAFSTNAQERIDRVTENKALAMRFQQSLPIGKSDTQGVVPQPAPLPAAKLNKGKKSAPAARDDKKASVEYAYQHAPKLLSDTLLWHPTLWLADGDGEVRFDLANGQTTYRVLLLGHGPSGRFGFFETRLDVVETGR